ncbi:hypothetical protein IAU59_007591 [Kwoniella sp. CBS 9459]
MALIPAGGSFNVVEQRDEIQRTTDLIEVREGHASPTMGFAKFGIFTQPSADDPGGRSAGPKAWRKNGICRGGHTCEQIDHLVDNVGNCSAKHSATILRRFRRSAGPFLTVEG